MNKYKVEIPEPKSKRLTNKKISIVEEDGWGYCNERIRELHKDTKEYEFWSDAEWSGKCVSMDGVVFSVKVEFTNDIGSRREVVELTPIAIGGILS